MWSPLWFILVCKIPPRLPIQTAHHTFLESRHPEVTKNLYCFVHPPEPNNHFFRLQLMDYLEKVVKDWFFNQSSAHAVPLIPSPLPLYLSLLQQTILMQFRRKKMVN